MIVRAVRALLSVVVGLLALCGWIAALTAAICLTGGYLNLPDLRPFPGWTGFDIGIWLAEYVAITAFLTGIWPAIRAGRWAWRRSARWAGAPG